MKKKIYDAYLFFHHCFFFFSCYFNFPKVCAFLLKISFFQPEIFRNKSKSKKVIIVLDRVLGARQDLEIVQKDSNKLPQLKFMRRKLIKLVFFHFMNKRKLFFNYTKLSHTNRFNYYDLPQNSRMELEKFWTKVIYHLKKIFKHNQLNFLTFAYFYSTEYPLYAGCNNNNIPVKLWNKESFGSEPDLLYRGKSKQFKQASEYFYKISVYNEPMKKMFLNMNINNKKKVEVIGYPKAVEFLNKSKKKKKRINNILFLSFDTRLGFPSSKKFDHLNFNITYDKIIKILNKISNNKQFKICIKKKNKNPLLYKSHIKIDKKIKVIEVGNATKYINEADIVIGLNSSSTLEALINGKYVFIPFFEKNASLKKYLYKFNKEIIINNEKKLEKKILKLYKKSVLFPLANNYSKKTISYYFGDLNNEKKIKLNCLKFLNS